MRRSRLLLSWEAGAFLGHRMLVASAAELLASQGHEVTVAAPIGAPAPFAVPPAGVNWQCCIPPLAQTPDRKLALPWESRATSLWHAGFHSPELVKARAGQWRAVLARFQPDLCVLQAAPFAQLAARAAGIRSVEFGIGFDVPPIAPVFPPFRGQNAFDAEQAALLEQRICDAIFAAEPGLSAMPTDNGDAAVPLSRLVAGDLRLVTSIPELDHYERAPGRVFVGPLPLPKVDAGGDGGTTSTWPDAGDKGIRTGTNRRPRVLAYLRHESVDMGRMLQAIASLGQVSAIVVCTDALPAHQALAQTLSSGSGGACSHVTIHLHGAPLDLAPLLPHADVVISHGGGLLAEALVRGRPCVVLPSHYEQFLAAKQAARHGLAVVVNPASEPRNWTAAVQHALSAPALLKARQAVQRVHRAHVEKPGAVFLAQALKGLELSPGVRHQAL